MTGYLAALAALALLLAVSEDDTVEDYLKVEYVHDSGYLTIELRASQNDEVPPFVTATILYDGRQTELMAAGPTLADAFAAIEKDMDKWFNESLGEIVAHAASQEF